MIQAEPQDKAFVVNILTQAFDTNKNVNSIIRQDHRRQERIRGLMAYSFEICRRFGEVFLSEDKRACALVIYPDRKKTTFDSVWLDIKLAFGCLGLSMVRRVLNREARIKKLHPQQSISYLWFLGVDLAFQHQGLGKALLREVMEQSNVQQRPVYLATSMVSNVPWYQKAGFEVYHELDLGYTLYFVRYPYV